MAEKSTGAELIAAERKRQTDLLGYDRQHDNRHDNRELVRAAAWYLTAMPPPPFVVAPLEWKWNQYGFWPWSEQPDFDEDRVVQLVKAGALIAAEIDRLRPATTITASGGHSDG